MSAENWVLAGILIGYFTALIGVLGICCHRDGVTFRDLITLNLSTEETGGER